MRPQPHIEASGSPSSSLLMTASHTHTHTHTHPIPIWILSLVNQLSRHISPLLWRNNNPPPSVLNMCIVGHYSLPLRVSSSQCRTLMKKKKRESILVKFSLARESCNRGTKHARLFRRSCCESNDSRWASTAPCHKVKSAQRSTTLLQISDYGGERAARSGMRWIIALLEDIMSAIWEREDPF